MAKQEPLKGKKWRRGAAILIVLLFSLAIVDYWGYPYGAAIRGRSHNRGENGLWLRYLWYFGQHSEAETHRLAQQLRTRQIRYAYFHVRHVDASGRLGFHYADKARSLTALLHHECPDVKLLAWVDAFDVQTGRAVPLTDKKTRRVMAAEAAWLVQECGFDGVQWDVEPCPNGDADFLALMQETRAALPAGKLLSTATPMWMPAGMQQWGWSYAYFARVAATCDQMAVMGYDSGAYFPRSYVWLMRQQAIHVPRAAAQGNALCRVLLGVPTYGSGLPSHNPRAENPAMALRGICEGLNEPQADLTAFAGVALFAEYTTSDADWQTYRRLWLAP